MASVLVDGYASSHKMKQQGESNPLVWNVGGVIVVKGLRFGFVARIGVTGWCRYPTPKIRLVVSLKCFLAARSAVSLVSVWF